MYSWITIILLYISIAEAQWFKKKPLFTSPMSRATCFWSFCILSQVYFMILTSIPWFFLCLLEKVFYLQLLLENNHNIDSDKKMYCSIKQWLVCIIVMQKIFCPFLVFWTYHINVIIIIGDSIWAILHNFLIYVHNALNIKQTILVKTWFNIGYFCSFSLLKLFKNNT